MSGQAPLEQQPSNLGKQWRMQWMEGRREGETTKLSRWVLRSRCTTTTDVCHVHQQMSKLRSKASFHNVDFFFFFAGGDAGVRKIQARWS